MNKNAARRIKIKLVFVAVAGLLPFAILMIAVISMSKGFEKEAGNLSSFLLPRVMYGQKIKSNIEQIRMLEYRYCFTRDKYEQKSVEKEIGVCIRDTRKVIVFFSNHISDRKEHKMFDSFKKDFDNFISDYRWITSYMNSGYQDSVEKIVLNRSQVNYTRVIREIKLLTNMSYSQVSSATCTTHSKIINANIVSAGILPVMLIALVILVYLLLSSVFRSSVFVFKS